MNAKILRFPITKKQRTSQIIRSADMISKTNPEDAVLLYREAVMHLRMEAVHRERLIRVLIKLVNKYKGDV